MNYLSKITVNHHFVHMTELLEKDLLDALYFHLEGRLSGYLESALKHDDAELHIKLDMKKTDADLYDGSFVFHVKGMKEYTYEAHAFKDPKDLLSHATQHYKEWLSDEIKK
jgi:hypothetical protein